MGDPFSKRCDDCRAEMRDLDRRVGEVEKAVAVIQTATGTEADRTGLFGAIKRSFDAIEKVERAVKESSGETSQQIAELKAVIEASKNRNAGRLEIGQAVLIFIGAGGGVIITKLAMLIWPTP